MKSFLTSSTLALVLGFASVASASFPDVPSSHPHSEAINYLKDNNIVAGNPDGTYKPGNNISRAAFTKIIVETYFSQNDINNCSINNLSFPDVDKSAWFAPYVCVAFNNNLVKGYDDGTFKPGNNINVAEAAKIISAYRNGEQSGTPWFKPYIEDLGGAGAIPSQVSAVDQMVNRGVMAEMIFRLKAGKTNKAHKKYADFFPGSTTVAVTSKINIPGGSFPQTGSLSDVSNGVGSGTASARFENGKYTLVADMKNLPDPQDDYFYEGWIVRQGVNLSVVSTGEAVKQDGKYINVYETNKDLSDHLHYVLTLEPNDGDPAPAGHILEGNLNALSTNKVSTDNDSKVMVKMINVPYSENLFNQLVEDGESFILNFHADWCPTCNKLSKELVNNINDLSDDTIVLKTDYDAETALKKEYGVTRQTTGVYFEDGVYVETKGGLSFEAIKAFFQE